MAYLLLLLPALASVLLAAHFYRAGQVALAAASLALIALLAVPRRWAARAVQIALALGALEWLRTLAVFAAARISAGQPYLRLAVILLAVAAVTALSALVFRHARLRVRYNIGGKL
jgi:hypothetical protein